jgi:hypothetical protein
MGRHPGAKARVGRFNQVDGSFPAGEEVFQSRGKRGKTADRAAFFRRLDRARAIQSADGNSSRAPRIDGRGIANRRAGDLRKKEIL